MSNKPLIAMLHLPRLVGNSGQQLDEVIRYAVHEMTRIEKCGFDGVMVENFSDTPFSKTEVSESVLTKFAIILHEIRKSTQLPIGVNILRNACVQAITVATVTNSDFIRCNIWEGAYVTDQGIIEGAAQSVIDRKNALSSEVKVLADIYVKHAKPLKDFGLIDAAENALKRGKADGLIISGKATGQPVEIKSLEELNSIAIKPLLGSGLSVDNLNDYADLIGGAIVGTSVKENNLVTNPLDVNKATKLVEKWVELR